MTVTVGGAPKAPLATGLDELDGADVTLADAATQIWWTGTAGWTINAAGTGSEASPWEWNTTINRPKLWFVE